MSEIVTHTNIREINSDGNHTIVTETSLLLGDADIIAKDMFGFIADYSLTTEELLKYYPTKTDE